MFFLPVFLQKYINAVCSQLNFLPGHFISNPHNFRPGNAIICKSLIQQRISLLNDYRPWQEQIPFLFAFPQNIPDCCLDSYRIIGLKLFAGPGYGVNSQKSEPFYLTQPVRIFLDNDGCVGAEMRLNLLCLFGAYYPKKGRRV